jgi:hypothetical protein
MGRYQNMGEQSREMAANPPFTALIGRIVVESEKSPSA